MGEGWTEFYLMLGSSAAVLIGLLFVVATLRVGRDQSELDRGHLPPPPQGNGR